MQIWLKMYISIPRTGIKFGYFYFFIHNDTASKELIFCGHGKILLVPKLEYSRKNLSTPWLFMPWLLPSPGHQQQWHGKYRIIRSLFSKRKCISFWRHLRLKKWQKKCKYFIMFLKINSAPGSPYCGAIWWDRTWSTLAQVMACCLKAPSHYLNQCWFLISEVLWHSHESNFIASARTSIPYTKFENNTFKPLI